MHIRSRLARMLLTLIPLTVGAAVLAQDQPGQVKYPTALDSLDSMVRVTDDARAVLQLASSRGSDCSTRTRSCSGMGRRSRV
jgi:hypothetical protein